MITDTASIETNLPGGTVPVGLGALPSRHKSLKTTSVDFQDQKINLTVPLVEAPFPSLPAFLPVTKNRPSPGFQPLIVAVPSHRRPATESTFRTAKKVDYVQPSTAAKHKSRNVSTPISIEVVPSAAVSSLEVLIKSNLSLSHVVSEQKNKNANTFRISSTSIEHFLHNYKQAKKSGPAAMMIQRWWRMLTLRRKFLKYYAFYKKQRTSSLMPFFYALHQITAASNHYKYAILRKTFNGWREAVIDKEPKELFKVPEHIDKLSLQLTTFVAFKEASKGSGVDKLVTAFRLMGLERTFKRAFYFWLRFVRERKRRMRQLAELIRTTAAAITHTKMKLVFTMWRRYTRVKKCEKLHRPLPEFQKPYETWDIWYAVHKRKAGLVKLAHSRWREKKLSKAFVAWKLYVDVEREKRQKLHRAEQHLMIRRAGVCFKAWKEHTRQMRMIKQIGMMTLKAWRTWTKLRTRLKSNFVLIHIRRTMFKQQACFRTWKKYYEYRVSTISAGVVAIRNDPARVLWAVFAWQSNKPHFQFLSVWLHWSKKAKRRLCLKRFLLAKQQLRNRKLMQLCFTALKMHHKSPVELDIHEAQPTPEELVELLEKIKIGALRPENTCAEQLYAETFLDGSEEPKTKRTLSMPEIKRKKRPINHHASQPDPERLLQRKLRHEKLLKLTPAKQKLFFLNEAVDNWLKLNDAPLWIFITALLLEQKAKKTAELKQMLRGGLDPAVRKLAKTKETLGKMGITNPQILKAFYNEIKLDMLEAHEVMEWKEVRDNYLLLADTALDAAKALNEISCNMKYILPEFTLEQDRKRFKRDPFPAYEFPNKFKALAPPNFKVKQIAQQNFNGSVSESSDSDVDKTSSPAMSVESILPRRTMFTDIYSPLPSFSTDKTLFDLIRDLVNAHKQLEILEGANKVPKAKPPIGEEIAAATKAQESIDSENSSWDSTVPTSAGGLVFNPELESIYQSVVLNNPPLPSFDSVIDLPWLSHTEDVSELEQQKFLRFNIPSNNTSSLISTRRLSSKPNDHLSDAKAKMEEIQKKKSEEAQRQREEFQTLKERKKQEEQDKLRRREKQIQREKMQHEKAKRKAREKIEQERQKRKEEYEKQMESERLAKFSDEHILIDKSEDGRKGRGRNRSEYLAEEDDELTIRPKPRSAKRISTENSRAITPEAYNRLVGKVESPAGKGELLVAGKVRLAPRLSVRAQSVDGLVRYRRSEPTSLTSTQSNNTLGVLPTSPGHSPFLPLRDRKPYFPGLITEKTDSGGLLTIKRLHVPPPRPQISPRSPKSPSSPRSPRSSTENSSEELGTAPAGNFQPTTSDLKERHKSYSSDEQEEAAKMDREGVKMAPKAMAANMMFLVQSPSQLEIELKGKPAKNPISQRTQGSTPALLAPDSHRLVSAPQSEFVFPARPVPEFRIMQSFFSKASKIEELPTAPPKEFQLEPTPSKPFITAIQPREESSKPPLMIEPAPLMVNISETLDPIPAVMIEPPTALLEPMEESQDAPVRSPNPTPLPSPQQSPRAVSASPFVPHLPSIPAPHSNSSQESTDDESEDELPLSVKSREAHSVRSHSQGSAPVRLASSSSFCNSARSRWYSFYNPPEAEDEPRVVKRYYEPVVPKRIRPHTAHSETFGGPLKRKENFWEDSATYQPVVSDPLPMIQPSLPGKIRRQKPVESATTGTSLPELDPIAALLENELSHLRRRLRSRSFAVPNIDSNMRPRRNTAPQSSMPLVLPSPRRPATAVITRIVIKDSHTIEYVPANSGPTEQPCSPPKMRSTTPPAMIAATIPTLPANLPPVVEIKFSTEAPISRLNEL